MCREMASMMQLGEHRNITKLYEVLELVQDSKTTLFLVLELVTGGEMFDRMKAGHGNSEEIGRKYFAQLLSGISYCHARGVCHRDLKPENLLLSDPTHNAILKMADFGLSAVMFAAEAEEESGGIGCGVRSRYVSEENKAPPPHSGSLLGDHIAQGMAGSRHGGGIPAKSCLPPSLHEGSPVRRFKSVVGSPHYVPPEVTAGT